ncbi:hypothetical protein ACSLNK_28345, partial [Escherichia coli]
QHIQIIIDNGLTGDTEQLAIGRQCNSGLFISGGDVFIFRPFTHSTSDFGNILLDVANKAILQGWEDAPETYEQWTRKGQLSD